MLFPVARNRALRQLRNRGTLIRHRLFAFFAVALFAGIVIQPAPAAHQPQEIGANRGIISVEKNETLFDTLSALYAAGYGADATWRGDSPELAAYRAQLRELHGPAALALRAYYRGLIPAGAPDMLSRFVSFGIVVGPPPNFPSLLTHEQLPPDVLGLDDLNQKLAAFYSEAGLAAQWARFSRAYDRQVTLLQGPVSKLVIGVNGYLREVVRPSSGREFVVIVEPLIGARTNFRIYGSRYTVTVASGDDPPLDDIRHAYLHFLLDPLVYKYGEVVDTRRRLMDIAGRAPRLPSEYLQDFPAFVTECLIKAVELRLQKLPMAKLDEQFDANDANGFILVRPFYDGLQKFEQSDPAMSFYFPTLMESISVSGTEKRLANFRFPPALAAAPPPERPPQRSAVAQWLEQGNDAIAAGDALTAAGEFQKVLQQDPHNTQALYGLAVASLLKGDAKTALPLLEQVTASAGNASATGAPSADAPDPSTLAWAHVYLGRIRDVEGQRDLALAEYKAALAVANIPSAAESAARQGLQSPYRGSSREAPATPK